MEKKINKKEISYNKAVEEIEVLLEELSTGTLDVDKLSEKVKRATELITLCKGKLRNAENAVEEIFNEKK